MADFHTFSFASADTGTDVAYIDDLNISAVPEPSVPVLAAEAGAAVSTVGWFRRRKSSR